jgi:hypothetical protein
MTKWFGQSEGLAGSSRACPFDDGSLGGELPTQVDAFPLLLYGPVMRVATECGQGAPGGLRTAVPKGCEPHEGSLATRPPAWETGNTAYPRRIYAFWEEVRTEIT